LEVEGVMLRRFDRVYDEIEKLMNAALVIGAVIAGILVVNAVAKPTISAALGWAHVSDVHLGFAEKAVLCAVAVVVLRAFMRRA
jgi:hypothetical protein